MKSHVAALFLPDKRGGSSNEAAERDFCSSEGGIVTWRWMGQNDLALFVFPQTINLTLNVFLPLHCE